MASTETLPKETWDVPKINWSEDIVKALPPEVMSGSSLTSSYRIVGEDTLTAGNQARWVHLKGLVATFAQLETQPGESLPAYNALLNILAFAEGEGEFISRNIKLRRALRKDVTDLAREKLPAIANRELAEQVASILDRLSNALNEVNTNNLPSISLFEIEDGSLFLEWIFPHHRIGFNIEPEKQDSGWFLVSDSSAQGVNAWGSLLNADIDWLISWLLKPILDYYL